MQKYYKIIIDWMPFVTSFDIADIDNIKSGSVFSAIDMVSEDKSSGHIRSEKPVIHFCDNAFDTMLWHNIFAYSENKTSIYEITPIGPIIKQKAPLDAGGIYQCGAEKISFNKYVPIDEMYDLALQEFLNQRYEKTKMYPHIKMANMVHAWIRHQGTKHMYQKTK